MKYLTDYVEKPTSELLEKNGAFWAFGNDQFKAKANPALKYADLGMGLIAPSANAKAVLQGLEQIHKEAIKTDLAENGKTAIIKRELYNMEAFYIFDWATTAERLQSYEITADEVKAEFYKELPNAEI